MYNKNLANSNKHQAMIVGLRNEVKILLSKIDALSEQNQQLTTENQQLRETVASLKHKLFGKRRDKHKKSSNSKRNKKNQLESIKNAGRQPKNKDLPIDTTFNYTFEQLICSDCNGALRYIGSNDSTHVEHKTIVKNIKISKSKYICTCCQKITVANGAKLPIPKGTTMPGLLTKVVLDKFGNAVPAYRQAQNYNYCDLNYSRQMICNWHMRGSDLLNGIRLSFFSTFFRQMSISPFIRWLHRSSGIMTTYSYFLSNSRNINQYFIYPICLNFFNRHN
jgi:transposase